jgi:hypothetical protein
MATGGNFRSPVSAYSLASPITAILPNILEGSETGCHAHRTPNGYLGVPKAPGPLTTDGFPGRGFLDGS